MKTQNKTTKIKLTKSLIKDFRERPEIFGDDYFFEIAEALRKRNKIRKVKR